MLEQKLLSLSFFNFTRLILPNLSKQLLALMLLCVLPLSFALEAKKVYALGSAPEAYGIGLRSMAVVTKEKELLSFMIWYPTLASKGSDSYYSSIDSWTILGARSGVRSNTLEALFPIIILSHDTGQSRFSNHELCSFLASKGFVVLSVNHHGDSFTNVSSAYLAAMFFHRPRQIMNALDAIEADEQLGAIVNLERIGVLGVGLGAVTALQLAGVDVDFKHTDFFDKHLHKGDIFSVLWVQKRLSNLEKDSREIKKRYGKNAFKPFKRKISAVSLLTPGGLFLLNQKELAELQAHFAVIYAEKDELYSPALSGEELLEVLPEPLYNSVNSLIIKNSDHYSLAATCPEFLEEALPDYCGAVPLDERSAMHKAYSNYFEMFFKASLGLPEYFSLRKFER